VVSPQDPRLRRSALHSKFWALGSLSGAGLVHGSPENWDGGCDTRIAQASYSDGRGDHTVSEAIGVARRRDWVGSFSSWHRK
jgi:hypothetical protein